jgi:hypothetical protein
LQTLRVIFIFAFILSWEFSSWPQIFSFPPRLQEAKADGAISTMHGAEGKAVREGLRGQGD